MKNKKEEYKKAKKELYKLKMKKYMKFAPLFLSAGFILLSGKVVKDSKNIKCNYNIESTYDNDGNVETNYLKQDESNNVNTIEIYSSYKKNDNNKYEREYSVYNANNISEDNVKEYMNNENITELLGEPISKGIELKDKIDEEKNIPYVKAKIYSKSEDKYYYIERPVDEFLSIALYSIIFDIIAIELSVMASMNIAEKYNSTDYKYDVEEIEDKIKSLKMSV